MAHSRCRLIRNNLSYPLYLTNPQPRPILLSRPSCVANPRLSLPFLSPNPSLSRIRFRLPRRPKRKLQAGVYPPRVLPNWCLLWPFYDHPGRHTNPLRGRRRPCLLHTYLMLRIRRQGQGPGPRENPGSGLRNEVITQDDDDVQESNPNPYAHRGPGRMWSVCIKESSQFVPHASSCIVKILLLLHAYPLTHSH